MSSDIREHLFVRVGGEICKVELTLVKPADEEQAQQWEQELKKMMLEFSKKGVFGLMFFEALTAELKKNLIFGLNEQHEPIEENLFPGFFGIGIREPKDSRLGCFGDRSDLADGGYPHCFDLFSRPSVPFHFPDRFPGQPDDPSSFADAIVDGELDHSEENATEDGEAESSDSSSTEEQKD